MKPLGKEVFPFDSLSMTYLLHCLPGDMEAKGVIFGHLSPFLSSEAMVFGATLLGTGVERSWVARRLMDFYNRKGIFSNQQDSPEGLKEMLEKYLDLLSFQIIGCAALFSGRFKKHQ